MKINEMRDFIVKVAEYSTTEEFDKDDWIYSDDAQSTLDDLISEARKIRGM